MDEHDDSFIVEDESQLDRLTIPNGFALDGESIQIQVVYDGTDVTYRDEDGTLSTMGVLCYLDHVLSLCIRDILGDFDENTPPAQENVVVMGHVLAQMIQYLHSEMHNIELQKHIREMGSRSNLGGLLAALSGASMDMGDGEEGSLKPLGAFMMGPDGELRQVDMSNPDVLAAALGIEMSDGDTAEDESEQVDDDDDDKIIIG